MKNISWVRSTFAAGVFLISSQVLALDLSAQPQSWRPPQGWNVESNLEAEGHWFRDSRIQCRIYWQVTLYPNGPFHQRWAQCFFDGRWLQVNVDQVVVRPQVRDVIVSQHQLRGLLSTLRAENRDVHRHSILRNHLAQFKRQGQQLNAQQVVSVLWTFSHERERLMALNGIVRIDMLVWSRAESRFIADQSFQDRQYHREALRILNVVNRPRPNWER